MKLCSIDGCSKKFYAKSLCNKHWQRYRVHGNANICLHKHEFNDPKKTKEDLFLSYVIKKENECWGWKGTIKKSGYASFSYKRKPVLAHRLSWEMFIGIIPNGLFVCHSCDNPICTNPKHLFLGTPKDNTQDCIKKGRFIFNVRNLYYQMSGDKK